MAVEPNYTRAVIGAVNYGAWGEITHGMVIYNGSNDRELDLMRKFTGHQWDDVLGLYYAKARMYDPATSRWLSPDLVKGHVMAVQTLNRYIYVLNNPLKFVDLWGLVAIEVIDGKIDFFAALEALGLTFNAPKSVQEAFGSEITRTTLTGSVSGPNGNYFTYTLSVYIDSGIPSSSISTKAYEKVSDGWGDYLWIGSHTTISSLTYQGGNFLVDVAYFEQLMCKIGKGQEIEYILNPINTADRIAQRDYMWHYMISRWGLTEKQTAAILGNIQHESDFSPTNAQDNYGYPGRHNPEYIDKYSIRDGVGWGIIQFTYWSLKQGLLDHANTKGGKQYLGDMDTQLEYLYIFMATSTETRIKNAWKSFTGPVVHKDNTGSWECLALRVNGLNLQRIGNAKDAA